MTLKVGDPAPDFSTTAEDGSKVKLADFKGRKLVIFFYPMDESPGCTLQACSLRDYNEDIAAKGAAILGVSAQSASAHGRFSERHKLNFPLLVDTDQKIASAYDATPTGLFGIAQAMMRLNRRVTYVIDEKGRIAHIIDQPSVVSHGEQVLACL